MSLGVALFRIRSRTWVCFWIRNEGSLSSFANAVAATPRTMYSSHPLMDVQNWSIVSVSLTSFGHEGT